MKHHHDNQDGFNEALEQILELSVLLTEDMAGELGRLGLTRSRAHVVWLVHQRGPMTQRALADAIGVSARNVTGLVDGLTETGFVSRQPHPSDRRATLVTLTEHGAATADDLAAQQVVLARALFAELPDREFDQLSSGLDHVVTALRTLIAEAS